MSSGPMPSRTISVWVARDYASAYAFLADPRNFPRWASGLGSSMEPSDDGGGTWLVQTPQGPMTVRFAEPNPHGVLDHHLFPPAGPAIHVPMRLLPNADGCEVFLTLFRQPAMTDAAYERDAEWVAKDLAELKRVLEAGEI